MNTSKEKVIKPWKCSPIKQDFLRFRLKSFVILLPKTYEHKIWGHFCFLHYKRNGVKNCKFKTYRFLKVYIKMEKTYNM